jgi:hypothetical protein
LTTWWNTFLLFSSHDYEEADYKTIEDKGEEWVEY